MRANNEILSPNRSIVFEETSIYKISLQNSKHKENIAVVKRNFAPDGKESLDKIIGKLIKAIDLSH